MPNLVEFVISVAASPDTPSISNVFLKSSTPLEVAGLLPVMDVTVPVNRAKMMLDWVGVLDVELTLRVGESIRVEIAKLKL